MHILKHLTTSQWPLKPVLPKLKLSYTVTKPDSLFGLISVHY